MQFVSTKAKFLIQLIVIAVMALVTSFAKAETNLQCRSIFSDKILRSAPLKESVSEPLLNDVIIETIEGHGQITSRYRINQTEALSLGEKWMGSGYKEIGQPGSGVYLSADGRRRFRIDNNSVLGNHSPHKPHVHLELLEPISNIVIVNNHIILN
ncbi:hypothetical protein [Bdellovibrio sp. HCB209]|uniref:hypothetical protein n=1 Tax=Bdellovibrio sp. HCB209 TaxID=3394354 RepID=UPI0039B60A8E